MYKLNLYTNWHPYMLRKGQIFLTSCDNEQYYLVHVSNSERVRDSSFRNVCVTYVTSHTKYTVPEALADTT